ncbi:MAG TPA: response regulator [Acidimicrobiales bacterium]|nr:response regulator [Acidimicrobiales bacterium]
MRHATERSTGARSRRILVVEDNVINQKVAVALLTQMGYGCDVATDGRQALEFMDQRQYGAVLMDCQMPVMDGYEATLEIRRREVDTHTAIVAMTASAMAADRERCLAVGMDDYLAKPIDRRLLASVLDQCVGQAADGPSPVPPPDEDPVDTEVLGQLRQLDGGQGLYDQLMEVFRREAVPRVPELRRAVASGDLAATAAVAHLLKGSCSTLGLRSLGSLLDRMECQARQGDPTELADEAAAVEIELARALERLDHLD